MAGSMKKIFIIGNLGRDPEERASARDGSMYVSFTIGVNDRPRRNQPGDTGPQAEEKPTWFRVTAFGRQAEIVKQYLRKGTSVFVSGDFSMREFFGQDGVQRTSLEVVMQDMQILTPKGGSEGGDSDAGSSYGGSAQSGGNQGGRPAGGQSYGGNRQPAAPAPAADGFEDDGDIPF